MASALWNPNYLFPMLGNPLTYGKGEAADVQLLNFGGITADGKFADALVSLDGPNPDRSVVSAQTFTYLVNNGDGTCGVAAEIHQTLAPVRLNLPPDDIPANDLLLEVGGDWVMKAVATGKPTGNSFSYQPTAPRSCAGIDPGSRRRRQLADADAALDQLRGHHRPAEHPRQPAARAVGCRAGPRHRHPGRLRQHADGCRHAGRANSTTSVLRPTSCA